MASETQLRKQQGTNFYNQYFLVVTDASIDLQTQYSNYKQTLQGLAGRVGEIEQEIEEHK